MDDLDYVLSVTAPWLTRYISDGPEGLSEREFVGVAVWVLESQVNNGGFLQYYFNTRGLLAQGTVDALRTIGAHHTASGLEAANADVSCWPLPEGHQKRIAVIEELAERARFAAIEAEFYQQREDRVKLLAQYLRNTSE